MDDNPRNRIAQQHISRMAEVFLTDPNKDTIMMVISNLIESEGQRKNMAYIVRDYCSERLRKELKKFAGLMEMKLLKHDPSRGRSWKSGDAEFHLKRIRAITDELEDAVEEGRKVGIKAADLANHAMMLADQAGELEDV